jgi:hypothetical protein
MLPLTIHKHHSNIKKCDMHIYYFFQTDEYNVTVHMGGKAYTTTKGQATERHTNPNTYCAWKPINT